MAVHYPHTRLNGALASSGPIARLRAVAAALTLALLAACASNPTRIPEGTLEPDKFLFERGMENLKEKRWFTAREYFRHLVDAYPQSPFRADAKLGIGDSFLGENTPEAQLMAINEYREFLSFYPTHERAHYAQFQLGMAHYNQMRNPYRDQTETKEAITEFTAYVQRYPDKPLIGEARQRLREAKDRLGQADFNVGLQYYRMRWYPGAVDRFLTLLKTDPEYSYRDSVYYYLGESFLKADQPAVALPYYERLLAEFEESEHLEAARKRVEELKALLAKKGSGT